METVSSQIVSIEKSEQPFLFLADCSHKPAKLQETRNFVMM